MSSSIKIKTRRLTLVVISFLLSTFVSFTAFFVYVLFRYKISIEQYLNSLNAFSTLHTVILLVQAILFALYNFLGKDMLLKSTRERSLYATALVALTCQIPILFTIPLLSVVRYRYLGIYLKIAFILLMVLILFCVVPLTVLLIDALMKEH